MLQFSQQLTSKRDIEMSDYKKTKNVKEKEEVESQNLEFAEKHKFDNFHSECLICKKVFITYNGVTIGTNFKCII